MCTLFGEDVIGPLFCLLMNQDLFLGDMMEECGATGEPTKGFWVPVSMKPRNRGYGQVMTRGGITTDRRTPLVNLPVALTGAA